MLEFGASRRGMRIDIQRITDVETVRITDRPHHATRPHISLCGDLRNIAGAQRNRALLDMTARNRSHPSATARSLTAESADIGLQPADDSPRVVGTDGVYPETQAVLNVAAQGFPECAGPARADDGEPRLRGLLDQVGTCA